MNELTAIWGSGRDDVWAVGGNKVIRWDGSSWVSKLTGLATMVFNGVWGSGPSDVWVMNGTDRNFSRWDGAAFSSVSSTAANRFNALRGTGADDIWAVGNDTARWNGVSWSTVTNFDLLRGVWASGANDAWAVGFGGRIPPMARQRVGHGERGGDRHAQRRLGEFGERRLGGRRERPDPPLQRDELVGRERRDDGGFLGVWGAAGQPVRAAGGTAYLRWDGAKWIVGTAGPLTGIVSLWGYAPSDVWMGTGNGSVGHWNGSAWAYATGMPINAFWGSGTSDVWGVGPAGKIWHFNGSAWSLVASGTSNDLVGVWGSAASDVWAVGYGGIVLHWNGTSWNTSTTGMSAEWLYGVWGSGPNDVWVVGSGSTIKHWNGTYWASVTSHSTAWLRAVAGTGPKDAWAVGHQGTLLRWDGSNWLPMTSGTTKDLYAVWANGSEVVAVGAGGTILARRP